MTATALFLLNTVKPLLSGPLLSGHPLCGRQIFYKIPGNRFPITLYR